MVCSSRVLVMATLSLAVVEFDKLYCQNGKLTS